MVLGLGEDEIVVMETTRWGGCIFYERLLVEGAVYAGLDRAVKEFA